MSNVTGNTHFLGPLFVIILNYNKRFDGGHFTLYTAHLQGFNYQGETGFEMMSFYILEEKSI